MGDVRFLSLFGGKLEKHFNLGTLNRLYGSRRQFNFLGFFIFLFLPHSTKRGVRINSALHT